MSGAYRVCAEESDSLVDAMAALPVTVYKAMENIHGGFELKEPAFILVRPAATASGYPGIVKYEWPEEDKEDSECATNPVG